jgi:hypothetical protein
MYRDNHSPGKAGEQFLKCQSWFVPLFETIPRSLTLQTNMNERSFIFYQVAMGCQGQFQALKQKLPHKGAAQV